MTIIESAAWVAVGVVLAAIACKLIIDEANGND